MAERAGRGRAPKGTIERGPWQGTASQRRDAALRASAGRRLLGPHLPLADEAREGVVTLDGVEVKLTHLDKVWFADGLRKRDLLDYTYDVAEFVLPYLRDRPYTMKRQPEGAGGEAFFQKEAGPYAPDWVRTVPIASAGERAHINFVLCNDCPTLLYLVNAGCIDHNVWMSRWETPESPDFVLLDLDPGPRAPFARVVEVAQAIGELLAEFDIVGLPKTSGATGMHIWVPLAPGHTFRQSQEFAALLLRLAAERVPQLTTEVWRVSERPDDKVFLDFRQNAFGKTIPPPYSPRPWPGAPVSAPLAWREVKAGLDPASFNVRTMRKRLERHGDLFAEALPGGRGQTIAEMLRRLERGQGKAAGNVRPGGDARSARKARDDAKPAANARGEARSAVNARGDAKVTRKTQVGGDARPAPTSRAGARPAANAREDAKPAANARGARPGRKAQAARGDAGPARKKPVAGGARSSRTKSKKRSAK